jgi:hypothetical protein
MARVFVISRPTASQRDGPCALRMARRRKPRCGRFKAFRRVSALFRLKTRGPAKALRSEDEDGPALREHERAKRSGSDSRGPLSGGGDRGIAGFALACRGCVSPLWTRLIGKLGREVHLIWRAVVVLLAVEAAAFAWLLAHWPSGAFALTTCLFGFLIGSLRYSSAIATKDTHIKLLEAQRDDLKAKLGTSSPDEIKVRIQRMPVRWDPDPTACSRTPA